MVPNVRIKRTLAEDGTLESISFKSASLPRALQTASVVAEAVSNGDNYVVTHRVTKKNKHIITLS